MKKRPYPIWALPTLSAAVPDLPTARARLGAQAANAKLTEEQLSKRGKRMHRNWMKKTTPEQRQAWARKAAAGGVPARIRDLTFEQRQEFGRKGYEAKLAKYGVEGLRKIAQKAQRAACKARYDKERSDET